MDRCQARRRRGENCASSRWLAQGAGYGGQSLRSACSLDSDASSSSPRRHLVRSATTTKRPMHNLQSYECEQANEVRPLSVPTSTTPTYAQAHYLRSQSPGPAGGDPGSGPQTFLMNTDQRSHESQVLRTQSMHKLKFLAHRVGALAVRAPVSGQPRPSYARSQIRRSQDRLAGWEADWAW